MTVLPDSGPTRSLNWRKSLVPVEASASVVSSPRTNAPEPAARRAAAAKPSMRVSLVAPLSAVLMLSTSSLDRGDLRDQRTEDSRDGGGRKSEDERPDRDPPNPRRVREAAPVHRDDDRRGRRQHRRDPGDVLLPLHPELVPGLGVSAHVGEEEVARRARARTGDLQPCAAREIVTSELLAIPRVD